MRRPQRFAGAVRSRPTSPVKSSRSFRFLGHSGIAAISARVCGKIESARSSKRWTRGEASPATGAIAVPDRPLTDGETIHNAFFLPRLYRLQAAASGIPRLKSTSRLSGPA